MNEWSYQLFEEKLGNKTNFGVLLGKKLSGKSTVAKMMSDKLGYTTIDMTVIADGCRKRLGDDENPFEGEVPIAEVEKDIVKLINDAQKSG